MLTVIHDREQGILKRLLSIQDSSRFYFDNIQKFKF